MNARIRNGMPSGVREGSHVGLGLFLNSEVDLEEVVAEPLLERVGGNHPLASHFVAFDVTIPKVTANTFGVPAGGIGDVLRSVCAWTVAHVSC